jgi:hypothetical protein
MNIVRVARFQTTYGEKVGHTKRSSSMVRYHNHGGEMTEKEAFNHRKYVGRKPARKARARR